MNFWILLAGGWLLLGLGALSGNPCHITGSIILFIIALSVKNKPKGKE